MTQAEGVRAWWAGLDVVDRGRLLRLIDDEDLLTEDLAAGLAMHGVTVVPAGVSPVDKRPEGWWVPPVLQDVLDKLGDS